MSDIEELDVIRLRDGREGIVLMVLGNGSAFEVEFDFSESSDAQTVKAEDIASVVRRDKPDTKAA